MGMIIYADVIFLLNFFMNTVVLLVTAYGSSVSFKLWRLLVAAAVGSVYVLGEWMPSLQYLYGGAGKFIGLLIIIYIAFGYTSRKAFCLLTGYFLISSFILGGAVLGWLGLSQKDSLLWGGNPYEINVLWTHLVGGVCMGLFLLVFVFRNMFAKLLQRRAVYQITIKYENRSICVPALLDTGNSLYGGVGKRPVVVVDYCALKPLLSEETLQFLDAYDPTVWLTNLAQCQDSEWIKKIQIVPYQAVGAVNLMLTFRPDELKVGYENGCITTHEVLIGVHTGTLSKAGVYTALLHSAVLNHVNLSKAANNKKEAGICVKLGQ